jgi:hypothetical protein
MKNEKTKLKKRRPRDDLSRDDVAHEPGSSTAKPKASGGKKVSFA